MTGYLDTPARSLEEVRAEMAAQIVDAEASRTVAIALGNHYLARQILKHADDELGQLRARLAQIDAEIKARVKP